MKEVARTDGRAYLSDARCAFGGSADRDGQARAPRQQRVAQAQPQQDGLVAGFFGGIVDSVIMRIADGLMSFPFVLLALILMTILGQGTFNVILAIGIGNVPYFARLVRGQVHIVKNEEYCNAERVLGASPARILFTHILPNAISPIIVYFTLNVASAIISEAALSFLGMGIQPPTASWGNILSGGRTCLRTSPHIATVSGIFILLTVLGFNLLGDGIRDVFDPKQKQ